MGRFRYCCPLLQLALLAVNPVCGEERRLRELIDERVEAAWAREGVSPTGPAGDTEFLRRVSLDLVGVIPTRDEVAEFLVDRAADKRERLVDRLLEDPRHPRHEADLWDLVLFGRHPPGYGTDKREGIQRWLRDQFAANRPYDEWVRELLRAEGNSVDQGPPLYYVQYRNQPEDLTEVVTQTFLGVQLQCARCHDHPFETWTQLDFYGMAGFFARLRIVEAGRQDSLTKYVVGEGSTGEVLFTGPAKDQRPGEQGRPVRPKFLLGADLEEPPLPDGFQEPKAKANEPPPPPVFSRKDRLADWLAHSENPYFARAIVNRVWAQYLGRGLVHPIDNMSPANEPTHPELLGELAAWLAAHQFDLRGLRREIVNSRVYQLSSIGGGGEAQPRWFQHARTRPLSAEELVESWRVATGFDEMAQDGAPQGTPSRYRPLTDGYVLRFFGQPNNGVGEFQGGLAEHLYLNNGQLGNLIVRGAGGLLDALADRQISWDERVDRLFLQVLSRPASDEERRRLGELLGAEPHPQERLQDVIWALMTCAEFRFNH